MAAITALMPEPKIQFFDNNGRPLSNGRLYTYEPGSPNVPKATYANSSKADVNPVPVVLNSAGRADSGIWLDGYYFMELWSGDKDVYGSTMIWSQDNVSAFGGSSVRLIAPWADTRDYGSLYGAVQDLGTVNNVTLTISSATIMGNNTVTIPPNISLQVISPGYVTVGTGQTLTINAPFQAGLYQVFYGDGPVVFGSGAVSEVYPEWWGAVGDGVVDCSNSIQAAFNSVSFTPVMLGGAATSSYYKITKPLVRTSPITLEGLGEQSSVLIGVGLSPGQYLLDLDNATPTNSHFKIKNLTLRSLDGVPNGIKIRNCSYSTFESLWLYNLYNGISIEGTRCFTNTYRSILLYQIGGIGVNFKSFSGGGHHSFYNSTFNCGTGLSIDSASITDSVLIENCNFEGSASRSINISGTVSGFSLLGCRTEGQVAGTEININPELGNVVSGLAITGCMFTSNGGAVVPITLGGAGGKVRGFAITGNRCQYNANPNFIVLNGDGESGLIAGNCTTYATDIVNVKRAGVVVFANEYLDGAGGKNTESWGAATWNVQQGSWTPTDASGAGLTLPIKEGIYQLIGNICTFQGGLLFPTTADTSVATIGGLPFTVYSGSFPVGRAGASISYSSSTLVTGIMLKTSDNKLYFKKSGGDSATNAELSGKEVLFFGSYRIA